MQDERSMILNMLKEGKISVEEADALLEVLSEGEDGDPSGFAAADASEPEQDPRSKSQGHSQSGDPTGKSENQPHAVIFAIDETDGEPRESDQNADSGGHKGSGKFNFDFDFSGLKDSLRETMKGVSEAVKDVMGDLSELDLGNEIFRAMGKIRAEAETVTSQPAGDASRLSITNKWGDVRLTGADTDDDTVTVIANGSAWGAAQADADDAIAKMDVRLELDGDTWIVKSGLEDSPSGRVRIDYEISLPSRMGVSASSMSGDIWIEELDGEQEIKTLSGDITIADLGSESDAGQVAKTQSGDIVGGALTGAITLSSLSGDVEINGFAGNLQIATQSGDITIHDGSGSVQLKTMSGDLDISLVSLGAKPVTVSSVSGDINLEIPRDCSVDVTAKSTSGDIDVDLELEFEKQSNRLVVGRRNGGETEVTVSTMSGDLSISE